MFSFSKPALVAAAVGALTLAPGALAAPPQAEDLNPPHPDFLTCKPLGAGTICKGSFQEVKESEPQDELVCGSGAEAFIIHDNAILNARATRWYNASSSSRMSSRASTGSSPRVAVGTRAKRSCGA